MRVMCINDKGWIDEDTREKCVGPSYGDICNVYDVLMDKNNQCIVKLVEWPLKDVDDGWLREAFVTIIDETIIHNKKEEYAI